MKSSFSQISSYVKNRRVKSFSCRSSRQPAAFTLLEMTIVLLILMALLGSSLFVNNSLKTWRRGRDAAEVLRVVYSAQRMYLSDNPTATVSTITSALVLPYMPRKSDNTPLTVMPTVVSLTGTNLQIKVDVSPPVVNNGSNAAYDPSGSTKDNLWDVGE